MAKLFFTEDYCKVSETGITEINFNCYLKQTSTLQSQLNTKGAFVQMFNKYCCDSLTLNGGITGSNTAPLSSGHSSTNDVILCLNIPDTNNKDSTYLK